MRVPAVALIVLAACASAPDRAVQLDPWPPAGSTTEVITASDGAELFARHWAPADAPVAIAVIVHGRDEDSARYAGLASRLAAAGYSVYAFDLRGHGRSSGPRGGPARWQVHVGDLDRYVAAIETREPGRPVFVLGYALGGRIAAAAAPRVAGVLSDARDEAEILAWLAARAP